MDGDWVDVRKRVHGLRLSPANVLAPSLLNYGIAYDTDSARAIAASDSAEALVIWRSELSRLPDAVLARFCLKGEVVFASDTFVILKSRKNDKSPMANWLARSVEERMHPKGLQTQTNRSYNGTYVDQRTVLSSTWWGDFIYVVSLDASITPHILREGRWEHWIEEPFRRMLRPGMNVVDIGCNVGYYALAACKAVGSTGHVTAIDANPEMTRLAQMSLACNGYSGMSRVLTAAVVKDPGPVTLSIPRTMLGGASTIFAAGGEDSDKVIVAGGPLDQLVTTPARIDLMKIDAEGAEPLIYAGGKSIINRDRDLIVFMEFSCTMIRATRDPQDFLNEIRSDGFAIYEIRPDVGPVAIDDAELVTRTWTEVILARDPSRIV
jgi:FkbM family methyltransferase